MFGQKLQIKNNIASSTKEVDGFRISLTVERIDGQPITQEEAASLLTSNILTMFTQRITSGL